MTDEILDSFRVLGVEPTASAEDIKRAYREASKVWHPDQFANDANQQVNARERLNEINRAYDRLQVYMAKSGGSTGTADKAPEIQVPDKVDGVDSKVTTEIPPRFPIDETPNSDSGITNKNKELKKRIIVAVCVIGGLAILVAVISSGSGSGNSPSTYSVAGGNGSPGGNAYTPAPPPTPAPVYTPPVSKALDEKNGFKDFRFGMTVDEVRAVLEPTSVTHNPGANADVLLYSGTAVNRIGEFATDSVWLRFYEGHLFRIDIQFSSYPNEIFDALKINYGEPVDNGTWTRGTEPLIGKSWQGEKVFAVILAPSSKIWDSVVIFDQTANQKARDYADKEPERAAKDFSATGFKSLAMGMRLEDLTNAYVVTDDNQVTGVKKVVLNTGEWLAVGFYPLRYISCEFFKDRLYRIDLSFEENRKEIFQTFQHYFGPLQSNDTWTRGSEKLTAKGWGNDNVYGVILAPGGSNGGEDWDSIVMIEIAIQREAEQFKLDAPKRAAKDL